VKQLRWLLTLALSAYACQLAVQQTTPIDRALPFIAAIVTVLAALSYPSLMLAVPLLIVAEIAIPDEGTRLLAFGAIVATICCWLLVAGSLHLFAKGDALATPHHEPVTSNQQQFLPFAITLGAIVLLRWIPFAEVQLGRELVLLALGASIVLVLDRTPFAVTLAVLAVLVTPAIPLRTLLVPLAVLFVAVLAKVFGMPRVTLAWPSAIALAFVMLFFAWSGVVARAFPYFVKRAMQDRPRYAVARALPARAMLVLDVPDGATSLIVSGANVAGMVRGTPLGTMDTRTIRIGDASDWGYLRRAYFYGTRNPLPRDPAGRLRGYGYSAWVDGAGRLPLPAHARTIRITADAALPPGSSLQVEGFE
jgi:hypothetical protein